MKFQEKNRNITFRLRREPSNALHQQQPSCSFRRGCWLCFHMLRLERLRSKEKTASELACTFKCITHSYFVSFIVFLCFSSFPFRLGKNSSWDTHFRENAALVSNILFPWISFPFARRNATLIVVNYLCFALAILWSHLWFITEQTYINMESVK